MSIMTHHHIHIREDKSADLFGSRQTEVLEHIAGFNHPSDILLWPSGVTLTRHEYVSGDYQALNPEDLTGEPETVPYGDWFTTSPDQDFRDWWEAVDAAAEASTK